MSLATPTPAGLVGQTRNAVLTFGRDGRYYATWFEDGRPNLRRVLNPDPERWGHEVPIFIMSADSCRLA